MRAFKRIFIVCNVSLFGGLCFAAAPIASFNLGTGAVQTQAASASQSSVNSSVPAVTPLTPEQRIARLENQVQYLSTYNTQLQSLSGQVEGLRGQLEDMHFQMNQLKTQIATLTAAQAATARATSANTSDNNANTDNSPTDSNASSTSNSSSGTGAALTTTAAAATTTANLASTANNSSKAQAQTASSTNATNVSANANVSPKEQAAFNQAYSLLVKQQYAEATTAFNSFLTTYPKSSLVPTAHYWLGDLYLASGQPDSAAQQYKLVVSNANADKRPDAMVKLGTILLAYGDNTRAQQLFTQVIKQYPKTSAASQAALRLKTIATS